MYNYRHSIVDQTVHILRFFIKNKKIKIIHKNG